MQITPILIRTNFKTCRETSQYFSVENHTPDNPSEIFTKMYYQIRDADSNRVVIPFETKSNGTRLSTDSDGMYFDFYMNSLASGKTYIFDFLITSYITLILTTIYFATTGCPSKINFNHSYGKVPVPQGYC